MSEEKYNNDISNHAYILPLKFQVHVALFFTEHSLNTRAI